jgi:hypothetical protein
MGGLSAGLCVEETFHHHDIGEGRAFQGEQLQGRKLGVGSASWDDFGPEKKQGGLIPEHSERGRKRHCMMRTSLHELASLGRREYQGGGSIQEGLLPF